MFRILVATLFPLLSLALAVPASAMPGAPPLRQFGFGAEAAESLYVYNAGVPGEITGEYARYSVPNLQLQETTVADGVGSPVAFGRKDQPFFVDESPAGGFGLFGIPAGTGTQPGIDEFSGIPCYASSLATGPTGNYYVVQYCSSTVLEYSAKPAGGGSKSPIATYSGGNFGGNGQAGPTYAVVDKKGGLYVGDTGGGVTYFAKGSKTPVIALASGMSGYVNQMVADDKGDVWSIHGPDPTPTYFESETTCVVDPSGTVVRNELGERFSDGKMVQALYTLTSDNPYYGEDGLSLAVDAKLRVYASVGAASNSAVLDYDPGQSCPNDGLTIPGVDKQDAQVAVDARKNLYVTDYVDNTIAAYKGGSTIQIGKIAQQSGLINMLYAAVR